LSIEQVAILSGEHAQTVARTRRRFRAVSFPRATLRCRELRAPWQEVDGLRQPLGRIPMRMASSRDARAVLDRFAASELHHV